MLRSKIARYMFWASVRPFLMLLNFISGSVFRDYSWCYLVWFWGLNTGCCVCKAYALPLVLSLCFLDFYLFCLVLLLVSILYSKRFEANAFQTFCFYSFLIRFSLRFLIVFLSCISLMVREFYHIFWVIILGQLWQNIF